MFKHFIATIKKKSRGVNISKIKKKRVKFIIFFVFLKLKETRQGSNIKIQRINRVQRGELTMTLFELSWAKTDPTHRNTKDQIKELLVLFVGNKRMKASVRLGRTVLIFKETVFFSENLTFHQ